jgi:DNA-directed RNA polymerase subunit RPC12/RpoP
MNNKCLLCKAQITDTEFEYEDYFNVTRGHNTEAEGYICFRCLKETFNS